MECIIVYSSKTIDEMIENGGCGDWVANRDRVGKCAYIIATHSETYRIYDPENVHKTGAAYFIGKIKNVIACADNDNRCIVEIEEYAELNIDDVWPGNHNPVKYCKLSELDIDINNLNFKPFPSVKHKQVEQKSDNIETILEDTKNRISKLIGMENVKLQLTISN